MVSLSKGNTSSVSGLLEESECTQENDTKVEGHGTQSTIYTNNHRSEKQNLNTLTYSN
jgi:hypothetical protein